MHPKLLKLQGFMSLSDRPCIIAPDWGVYLKLPYLDLRDTPVLNMIDYSLTAGPFDPEWLNGSCFFAWIRKGEHDYCEWRML